MLITHDDDWSSIIQFDTSSLLDPHELVANILASQDIYQENEDVVSLPPEEIINEISESSTSVNCAQVPDADVTASQTAPSELPSQVEETQMFQQNNALQKVELSISEVLKKYCRDLGSDFFQGHRLVDSFKRIHDDVLKIWNFNDPYKVLSGEKFLKGMIGLVESLCDEVARNRAARANFLAGVVNLIPGPLVGLALEAMIRIMVYHRSLRSHYRKDVPATYLAAYIVDLNLVLYEISTVVMVDSPKSLSTDLVMDALAIYKSRSPHIHAQVKEAAFTRKLEEKIASVMRDALPR